MHSENSSYPWHVLNEASVGIYLQRSTEQLGWEQANYEKLATTQLYKAQSLYEKFQDQPLISDYEDENTLDFSATPRKRGFSHLVLRKATDFTHGDGQATSSVSGPPGL